MHADADAHADVDPDAYCNTLSHRHGYSDTHCAPYGHRDANGDGDADQHQYRYRNAKPHAH